MKCASKPILTVFPLGTGNDFARNFNLEPNLKRLEERLKNPILSEIDIGEVYFPEEELKKYFINILDVGLGAEVVNKMNRSTRFWGAQLTYLWIITTAFLKYKPALIKIQKDNNDYLFKKTISFIIANGAWFGNNIKIAPDAFPNDGLFHSTHLGDFSFLEYVINLPKAKKGLKIGHKKALYDSGKEFVITGEAEVEADGEYMGKLPAEVKLSANTIKFLEY